jgi:hypothetical protein
MVYELDDNAPVAALGDSVELHQLVLCPSAR